MEARPSLFDRRLVEVRATKSARPAELANSRTPILLCKPQGGKYRVLSISWRKPDTQ
jgi:hypothetical protein